MNNAQDILVVFLSTFLGLFLLLSVIAVAKVVQILNHLKSITARAEKIADTAEHVGDIFKYSAGPAALAKLLVSISEQVFSKEKKRKSKKDEE